MGSSVPTLLPFGAIKAPLFPIQVLQEWVHMVHLADSSNISRFLTVDQNLHDIVVMSVNNNATYHLAELDGTRIAVPIARKWIKGFKKRHEPELDRKAEEEDSEVDVSVNDGSGEDE